MRSDWLTTGPQVDGFEADLAGWTGGVPCVAVSNGTAALHVAYAAAGIGPGDEVITSPMTFVATASTAALHGARIFFADVEEDTANLDAAAVQSVVSARTRVVAAVDYAGHPAEYDDLRKVARRRRRAAAGRRGARDRVDVPGRAGRVARRPHHVLLLPDEEPDHRRGRRGGHGRPELLERARRFRTIGLVRDRAAQRYPDEGGWHQEVHEFGLNYRLPDVLCALGRSQLRRLPAFKARRAELTRPATTTCWPTCPACGCRCSAAGSTRPGTSTRCGSSTAAAARCTTGCARPASACRSTTSRSTGIRSSRTSATSRGMCPNAEAFYAEELSLPLFPDLTDADQDRVVEALRTILR